MTPASAVSIRSRLLKFSTSTLLTIALIAALALNIATLTVGSVFNLMSNAIEFIAAKTVGEAVTVQTKYNLITPKAQLLSHWVLDNGTV